MANRPLSFTDYIGQERMKAQLKISIGASRRNGVALPHTLITGNPGLGKTTIAEIIANEFGVSFIQVMAGNLNTAEDIERLFVQISTEQADVIFIDEIHRLPVKIEELFYPIMEDLKCEIDGEVFWVPPFTLIGATTLAGDLSRPLRDRFGLHFQLQNYQIDEIETIITRLAKREETVIEQPALYEIARRSKGVARIAVKFFHRCREFADFVVGDGIITRDVCAQQFDLMGIDALGLDENDLKVLKYLAKQRRPVGKAALAAGVDIDQPTMENMIEPYLTQTGLIVGTGRGREITERGLNWINTGTTETVRVENSTGNGQRRLGER